MADRAMAVAVVTGGKTFSASQCIPGQRPWQSPTPIPMPFMPTAVAAPSNPFGHTTAATIWLRILPLRIWRPVLQLLLQPLLRPQLRPRLPVSLAARLARPPLAWRTRRELAMGPAQMLGIPRRPVPVTSALPTSPRWARLQSPTEHTQAQRTCHHHHHPYYYRQSCLPWG